MIFNDVADAHVHTCTTACAEWELEKSPCLGLNVIAEADESLELYYNTEAKRMLRTGRSIVKVKKWGYIQVRQARVNFFEKISAEAVEIL